MNVDKIKLAIKKHDNGSIDKVWLRACMDGEGVIDVDGGVRLYMLTKGSTRRDSRILGSRISREIEDYIPDEESLSVMVLTGLPDENINSVTNNLTIIYGQ